MTVTAATVVAAFESVGAILVHREVLIVPGATARLLTDRLSTMLWFSVVVAGTGAVLGHVFALTIPAMICSRIGFNEVKDVGTAGMIAVTTGGAVPAGRYRKSKTWNVAIDHRSAAAATANCS